MANHQKNQNGQEKCGQEQKTLEQEIDEELLGPVHDELRFRLWGVAHEAAINPSEAN